MNPVIDRLDHARQVGRGQWICRCPAHDDRTPSMKVTETQDGRILIHCFAGCGTLDILSAIGLCMSDLFPDKGLGDLRSAMHWVHKKREDKIRHECEILEVAGTIRKHGGKLTANQMREEREAWLKMRSLASKPEE